MLLEERAGGVEIKQKETENDTFRHWWTVNPFRRSLQHLHLLLFLLLCTYVWMAFGALYRNIGNTGAKALLILCSLAADKHSTGNLSANASKSGTQKCVNSKRWRGNLTMCFTEWNVGLLAVSCGRRAGLGHGENIHVHVCTLQPTYFCLGITKWKLGNGAFSNFHFKQKIGQQTVFCFKTGKQKTENEPFPDFHFLIKNVKID